MRGFTSSQTGSHLNGRFISDSVVRLHASERREGELTETFLDLYDELRPSLGGYLLARGFTNGDVEDLVQDTFLQMHRACLEGTAIRNPRAWLFRTAHNLALNWRRDNRRVVSDSEETLQRLELHLQDAAPSPEDAILQNETHRRLVLAMQTLTEQQQMCLQLRAEGLTFREIGEVIGVTLQRVHHILHASLKRLAQIE